MDLLLDLTLDTRDPRCPIRIVYGPRDATPGDGVHASHLRASPGRAAAAAAAGEVVVDRPLAVIRMTEHINSRLLIGDVDRIRAGLLRVNLDDALAESFGSRGVAGRMLRSTDDLHRHHYDELLAWDRARRSAGAPCMLVRIDGYGGYLGLAYDAVLGPVPPPQLLVGCIHLLELHPQEPD